MRPTRRGSGVSVLRDLWSWLRSNPQYKLLSLALAVLAWSYVQLEQVGEGSLRARVVWKLPDGLMAVEQLPSHVNLTVRGTHADVRVARARPVRLPVDLGAIGVGEHHVEFGAFRPEGLPDTLEVLGQSPSAMTITLDEVAERKVAVAPVHVGEPAPGFMVDSVVLSPGVVTVSGPRGLLASMVDAKTHPIEVTGLSGDTVVPVDVDLPRSVTVAGGARLEAIISVVPVKERRALNAVPVMVWQQTGWVARPETVEVTLEGPAAALARVAQDEVVAIVHLPDQPDQSSYEAAWGPRDGVRLRVLHGAGDAVEVVRMDPPRVVVERR